MEILWRQSSSLGTWNLDQEASQKEERRGPWFRPSAGPVGKKVSPVTHEEVEDATVRFLAQGGVIEQLPDLWNAIREVDVRFQLNTGIKTARGIKTAGHP